MHYAMRTVHYLLFLSLGMSLSNAQVTSADTYEAGILSRSYISDMQRQIIGRSAYGNVQEKTPVKREEALQKMGVRAFIDLIEEYSALHSVDPNLIMAVVQVESGGNPNALSPKGAAGLMQLMPATAAGLGVEDRFDPEENIASGTRYLSNLINRFKSEEVALWAYNAGPTAVRQGRMPLETQEYVPKVLRMRRAYATEER